MKKRLSGDAPPTEETLPGRADDPTGRSGGDSRRSAKKRAILFSFAGVSLGLTVTVLFHLAGFWHVSLQAWGWMTVVAALYHAVLWLLPHLGWDSRLHWDPDYLYLPLACIIVFFSLTVYYLPDARVLIGYGYLMVLVLLVGKIGFRDVLVFSLMLSAGYFVAVFSLARRGETISLPHEAALATFYLAVSTMAGVILERTRQHRWELAGLRRRLTLAIQGSGAGWWDLTLDPSRPTEIPDEVYLSPELKALIGFEDHEFPNSLKAWLSRIHESDLEGIYAAAREHLSGLSQFRETRYRIRHRNGELLQMYGHSRIQRNSERQPVRWSGLEWDITERERAQETVRKLSLAVEQSPSIVIITDTEGRIEYVNPRFCRTTGYSVEEVVGRDAGILGGDEPGPPERDEKMWSVLRSGGDWQGEFRNRRKNGEVYVVISSISPIRDSSGDITHFVAVQEDVTERRRMETQLLQAQRMESVGQLVSGVAHDFNNLLTAVIGFADLGIATTSERDPTREHFAQIRKAGESAGELTRQLLAFGRQQILQFEVLDLNDAVRGVEKLLRRTIGEDVELIAKLAPGLWPVKADPTSIEQILVNLAVNARDAMPDGGRLTIETSNLDRATSRRADDPSLPAEAYVVLSVLDTGRGMAEETRARLFEPFFTTKERGRGTGLGLSTVYGVVKQSGGHIEVESSPGRGTRFDVYLPRTRETPSRETTAPVEASESGRETILLVEDDQRVRELVDRALSSRGYRVLAAADGARGLDASRDQRFDLLLTDIVMPGMSGLELAHAIAEERADLKVLYMSGYADTEMAGDRVRQLDAPFLAKPFRVDDLLRKVRETLDASGEARGTGRRSEPQGRRKGSQRDAPRPSSTDTR